MMAGLLGALQVFTPGDCVLTGLCGVVRDSGSLPSGLMFAALGLVAYGVVGLRRQRRP